MSNNAILIGADPEVFVRNPNSKKFVSAHGMIPGTKAEPFLVKNGAVQVDGMALEFNIDPARTATEFITNCNVVQNQLREMVDAGYEIVKEPVAFFDPEYYQSVPEFAKELGCDPDYNAYTGEANPRPPVDESNPMRTASGHVHIGWTNGAEPFDPTHFEDCRTVVRQLDYFLGVPSLYWDKDNRRRQMYGQAGAFRPKSYGVEYRVLSNRWLSDEALMNFVFESSQAAIRALDRGQDYFVRNRNYAQQVVQQNALVDLGFVRELPPLPKLKKAA